MTAVATPGPSRLRRGFAVVAGIVVALVLNEFVLSVAAPAYDPRQHVHFVDPDGSGPLPALGEPGTVTRQRKNTGDYDVTVRINRHGFRDSKDIAGAGPDDYVLVGDSFAFGWGVEAKERLSDVLQEKLGRRVFNIGVTGNFNTYQVLLDYAAAKGAVIRHVIVCVTMESDIMRYGGSAKNEAVPVPTRGDGGFQLIGLKAWLMRHSALYFATTTVVHQVPWLEALAVRLGFVVPNLEGIHQATFDPIAVEASADRLRRLADRYDTTVVLIPSRALWHGTAIDAARRTHEAFVAALRSRGIDVVDLRPAFERDGAPLGYHFLNDGHWRPRGHALAAETVAQHLRHRGN